MTNLTKLKFVALEISSKNYLVWILDAEIHLDTMNLKNIIKEGNDIFTHDHAKAMNFLQHHLHEGLKTEYLMAKNLSMLW